MKHWCLLLSLLAVLVVASYPSPTSIGTGASQAIVPLCANPATTSSCQESLRVATFNIQHGRGLDGIVDLQRTAAVTTAHAVDVLFLHEVDQNWPRSGRDHQAARLATLTGMSHSFFAPALRFVPAMGPLSPAYGNAVLSHVAWTHADAVPLPRRGSNEPRNLVVTHIPIDTNGKVLRLAATHLSTDRAERLTQIKFILDYFSLDGGPMLLLGDFNSQPYQADMQMLFDAGWIDLWPLFGQGDGLTFPSEYPEHRIDYVLASPAAVHAVRRMEVVDTTVSDHRPIIVELDLSLL